MMNAPIRIGTRKSALAMWQARHVAGLLEKSGLSTEIVALETRGDRMLDVTIAEIGSKGVFTAELEQALSRAEIDIAVHSAKDLASELPAGFSILAFTEREQYHDVLLSHRDLRLEGSGRGVVVGTSSTRRTAMLRHFYPEAKVVSLRGNLQTRMAKMERGDCDALMLAFAGVHRMNYAHLIRQRFDPSVFTPAAGQGSLAIEIHKNLPAALRRKIRTTLDHPETGHAIRAERAYLKTLRGGCSIPAFALAVQRGGELHLRAGIYSLDGSRCIHFEETGPAEHPETLGRALGREVLRKGGRQILHEIRQVIP